MNLNVNHCEPWENMCGLTASRMKHITGAMIKSVNTSQMITPPSEVRRFLGCSRAGVRLVSAQV